MPLGNAPGYPQHSGTVVPNVIWAGKLLVKFYQATVLAAISNTDFEGEISEMGDKVTIRTTPTIIIRDYVKGQQLETETLKQKQLILILIKVSIGTSKSKTLINSSLIMIT